MSSFYARQLHQLKVQAGSDMADCTIFPFFDKEGGVKNLLAVVPEKGLARVVPKESFKVQRFRKRILFDGGLWSHRKLSPRWIRQLSGLTHYDPWWLLAKPKFRGKAWVSLLKNTNCAGHFESFKDVLFDRRLQKVTYALKPDGQTLVPFKKLGPFCGLRES